MELFQHTLVPYQALAAIVTPTHRVEGSLILDSASVCVCLSRGADRDATLCVVCDAGLDQDDA